ncbi:bifunctional aminoglycoside phosphotransferase/ATP-binding protein [Candidatus Entotheonella palauensis]|uniref:bifunctional aminoglycoside phosphotransferase/ATP-binding protein n=1 Tax=Candidatus Entotheonella palauensis TaxID=93172 RepID=UPI0015C47D20|nr:bifunctional aminoglycoside phosphotransferase/ATP-binding protein [Candidatus Entotheonella palauensis]
MTLAALRQALMEPAIYPEPTTAVEIRETHISLVFLTDHYVYKIKKPIELGFVDYSTLDKRRAWCEQEVMLNRRLSQTVYLDVVPLYHDGSHYRFSDGGSVVEYAVKMRRLPTAATLEARLKHGAEPLSTLTQLARQLAAFHASHPVPTASKPYGTHERVEADWQENFDQTTRAMDRTLSSEQYHRIQQAVTAFLAQRKGWFEQRVRAERIRDCHGDLRAEHIYIEDGALQIIDCIEFNPQFRYIDVASEIAFLAMDLERLGFAAEADAFVQAYVEASQDVTLYRLLDFYRCYRAYVRGKVRSFLLQEAAPHRDVSRLQRDAVGCFALADRYAQRLTRPLLIMTTGLIGSGKSTVAEGVAEALDFSLFSSDRVRKARAGLCPETPQRVAFGDGLYSASTSEQTYEALANLARSALRQGLSVVVDATFSKQAQRTLIQSVGTDAGADCYLIDCVAPEAVIRERLEKRMSVPGSVSDGRWAIFPQFKQQYEPVNVETLDGGLMPTSYIRLDTTQPVERSVQQALGEIQKGRSAYDDGDAYSRSR